MRHTRRPARALAALLVAALATAARPADAQDVTVAPSPPGGEPVSEFLRPPGSDRYAPAVDWARIPPWRQTSFFGIRAQGTFFVYVVDCSGSMADDHRLVRAKAELRRALGKLQFPQRYLVIFYNDRPLPMPGGVPESAGARSRSRTVSWLGLIEAEGGTDPRPALQMAVSLRPDAVFLLADGEYPAGTPADVARVNPRRIPIHCIDLSGGAAGGDLRQIAKDSGGQYAARP